MSSGSAPSAADPVSSLGLPPELVAVLTEMGIDVRTLIEAFPEHIYIQQLVDYAQGLPDQLQRPVEVRDPGAFASFLGEASHGYFKKFLALSNVNQITIYEPESHRFRAEHYVPPIARLITQPDVPMFVATLCLEILKTFSTNGENTLQELCKVSTLPASLVAFIERICDDPVTQNNIQIPKMTVEELIRLLCDIIMKATSSKRLQPSGSTDPAYVHAQSLRSMCLRLLKRFKPLPLADAASVPAVEPSIRVTMPANALELFWAIGSLIGCEVPFPEAECRVFFNELLQYIGTENDKFIMHALICCLSVTLSKLHASPAAGASAVDLAAVRLQQQIDKQQAIRALINLLSQHPCDLGSCGMQQPADYTGDAQGQRQQRRRLAGHLSSLQSCTLFDLSLRIICSCIDSVEIAAFCVTFENSTLLSIVSKKLNDSTGSKDASQSIELTETLIDLLCNSNLRHAVSADETFPPDLVEPLYASIKANRMRQFFEETHRTPHAQRLHGGMVVPGRGEFPAMTLKQVANREETGGIPVLGYAAATNLRHAVRLLLRVGADPHSTGTCGKNAMQMNIEHNNSSSEMLDLLQSVKEIQAVSVKDSSKGDPEICMRVTGKSAAELVAPVWDILLDGAADTPHPDVCFSIFNSLFSTVISIHPAILENFFVAVIPISSDKTPRSAGTPAVDDTPSAVGESSSATPGFKVCASSSAERFFKLLRSIGKKFCKNKGIHAYALSALTALLEILKLPTAWPLARLCHKLRLVDPTLSELADSQGAHHSASASLPPVFDHGGCDDDEEDDGDEEGQDEEGEDEEDDGSGSEEAIHRIMERRGRERQLMMDSQAPTIVPAPAVDSPQHNRRVSLLGDIRAMLAPHVVSRSDRSQTTELEAIAYALNAAVAGPAGLPSPTFAVISATDALIMLCDPTKQGTYMEHLDTPEGCQVIEALCSYINSESPSPAPVGSISKVLRLSHFRNIACPSSVNSGSLKALIHHIMVLFEENQTDILALFENNPVPFGSHISSFRSGSRTRVVHLLPLPSDDGCSQHFGKLQSTFHHDIHSDLKSVATSLKFKDLVVQELPVAAVALPPQRRHPGQQGENFEDQLKWKELGVKFPPPQDSVSSCVNLEGHGLRFTPAVPCADFVSRTKKGTPKGAGGAAAQFQGMSKSKKKRAKLRAKRTSSADAAADAEGSEVETFLKPCDIARARLFLCFDSDVKDGKLPVVHLEVNPLHPLAESIAEFEKKFSGHKQVVSSINVKCRSAAPKKPHSGHSCIFPHGCGESSPHRSDKCQGEHGRGPNWSCCDQLVSVGSPFCDDEAGRSEQPIAIFYGSGDEFSQPHVPDELRWRIETLGAKIESGHVSLLDVVAAIKSAMPLEWLSEHGMDSDSTSVVFSMRDREILDVYEAALLAWGAKNVTEPVTDDDVLSSAVIPVECVAATVFDIPKTTGQPSGRGFNFKGDSLQVTFPNGPISCFSEALVGPLAPFQFAHISFKDSGSNSAWSVGLIPESQCHNKDYLWSTRGSIGRCFGGSGCVLPGFKVNRSDTITMCVDSVQGLWYLCGNGNVIAKEAVPPSYFPVRLAFCGHSSSGFQIIPGSAVPPAVLGQSKLVATAGSSGPVMWQWLHDDGSWVSYASIHNPALEKAYRKFICKADKPSRAFIELNVGHGSFRYQIDFREQCAAPEAAPGAPRDLPLCVIVGTQTNLKSMRAREIRRCTPMSSSAPVPAALSESHAVDEARRAELLLEAMQTLSAELEMCLMAFPSPRSGVVHDYSVDGFRELQSTLLSAMFNASKSSERHQWTQLATELPLVLSMKTRSTLFRKVSGTNPEDFQNTKKDRINGVERNRILEWAASIASASRGRRNPLAIQFSRDGVPEAGFGDAVTNSFYCDVADAFCLADNGMWIISQADIDSWGKSSDGELSAHRPLVPSNGLYIQPYCSSLPMPPTVLSRFKLLGIMMAKALHDGRAFPLPISYALARCICGQTLDFDDLSGIVNFFTFDVLKQIRCAVSGGPPISPEKFDFEWSLVFAQAANIVENDRIVLRQLHLVQGGDVIDVSDANAPEYLRAFERMYLGDGVALQIRALQSGFYSIIPQEHVAILGPSGLLHSLGCLTCPEFDLEDLRFGLEPKHGYDTQSPQYVWLIETLSKFDEPQRRALVRFLTGSPWLPNGFQGLQTRLTVQLQTTKEGKPADDSYFPVAQTCAGLFKLPRYTSAKRLKEALLFAIFDRGGFLNE